MDWVEVCGSCNVALTEKEIDHGKDDKGHCGRCCRCYEISLGVPLEVVNRRDPERKE